MDSNTQREIRAAISSICLAVGVGAGFGDQAERINAPSNYSFDISCSSSPSRPTSHPNPLASNPPEPPTATMGPNPQFPLTLTPSSAPINQAQEALRLGNALRTGSIQPRLITMPQDQRDGRGLQRGRPHHWSLPGREIMSLAPIDRPATERVVTGDFLLCRVGGVIFRLPMHILSNYQFWSALTVFEPPPQGWSMPDVNSDIFGILLECVYSTSGLHGTECGLNLVKLCYAFNLARTWGMSDDRRKLRDTIHRYIVRRILRYNPGLPGECRAVDYNHHMFRSEELYRTWELAQQHSLISKMLPQHDLIALYCCIIPQNLWPALTARFESEFTLLLHVSASARRSSAGVASAVDYRRWWLHYYRLAGFEDARWLSPEAHNRLFAPRNPDENNPDEDKSSQERSAFAAARARGSAVVNAFEAEQARHTQEQQPVTPTSPTSPNPVTTSTTDVTATSSTQPVEEANNALENLPPPRRRPEARRVRFAPSPQVIILSPRINQVPMTAGDAALDSPEDDDSHGEAARAA